MSAIQAAKWEMVEAGGRTAQSFGFNRLWGQLYVYLFLSQEPMSLDALADGLGVSKASISLTGRQLESWGALRRVWIKGDRKDYYEAERDFSHIIGHGLLDALNKKLESGHIQIERCLDMLAETNGEQEDAAFLRERLLEAEQYRTKISKLLNNPLVRKIL